MSRAAVILLACFTALLAKVANAAEKAPVEFAGLVTVNEVRHFILFDPATKQNSFWLKPGQTWHGAKILLFDATREQLSIHHGGKEIRLTLRNAKIGTALAGGMLVQGSFTRGEDDTLIYSADAEVLLDEGVRISSPSGIMASDATQRFFVGDLIVKRDDTTLIVGNVTFDRETRKMKIRGNPALSREAALESLKKQ